MVRDQLIIHEFRPVHLTVDRIGPFQENVYELDFTNDQYKPCNFYMLVAANGYGKTTLLDIMGSLLGMIDQKEIEFFGHDDIDQGAGRAQLDVWIRCHWQGRDRQVIFSILAGNLGEELSLKVWPKEELEKYNATSWHRLGHRKTATGPLTPLSTHKSDELVREFLGFLRICKKEVPRTFNESIFPAPTTLCFSAYRDIPPLMESGPRRRVSQPYYWTYRSLHRFSEHNTEWPHSLDNLLVWFKWMDDGRFERACQQVNKHVFARTPKYLKRVEKDPPEAVVEVNNGEKISHPLCRLSSGEKNLTQLFLRIGAHMTRNTILLIDEFDIHLHIRWQYQLLNALKGLASQQDANITVIVTTHSMEMLEVFTESLGVQEEGLQKGGHLIENLS